MGIATQAGFLEKASIGVAKRLLFGDLLETADGSSLVVHPETREPLAVAYKEKPRFKPVFISVGAGVSNLSEAVSLFYPFLRAIGNLSHSGTCTMCLFRKEGGCVMEYNRLIDHTLLKADATVEQIEKLCKEALQYNFFSVCVNSAFVPLAKSFLEGSDVKVATTIGFPLGASATAVKAFEVEQALKEGADEFDMVINVGWLKSKLYRLVHEDIAEVVKAAGGKVVKVIIETCYLTDDEKKIASSIAAAAGAHYVKTSTGFGTGGATVEDVQLIRSVVGPILV